MIRLTCPGCQVRLNAKDELAGQTRKCPKCGGVLKIPEAASSSQADADEWDGLDDVAPDQHVHEVLDQGLPPVESPKRLVRVNRYLICDKSRLFAAWEGNGEGWMLKTSAGFVKVGRNADQLPSQGNYTLVELVMAATDDGTRLRGIHSYQLARSYALTALARDEAKILSQITGPGCLTKEQKMAVQEFLREQFMRAVWGDAAEVLDYLTNIDYHSPGVGQKSAGA
ncbi:MAG: hypothetical protein ABIP48_20580 [Planctomycetota bacterium]